MMKLVIFFLYAIWGILFGDDIKKISLSLPEGMQRADLYYIKREPINAILILCPGINGNGRYYLQSQVWKAFAIKHNLGLVGLSFASSHTANSEQKGYYYPTAGSGPALLAGIKKIFGEKKYPLLLYGFSGGAHFTARFAEWQPERVLVWCAYSAMWWDLPRKNNTSPPGIIVCGDKDPRLGASMIYFKQGRVLGKPWSWLLVPNNDHSPDPLAETFIRDFFSSMLNSYMLSKNILNNGIIVDIDRKIQIDYDYYLHNPTLTAWFPNMKIFERWRSLYAK